MECGNPPGAVILPFPVPGQDGTNLGSQPSEPNVPTAPVPAPVPAAAVQVVTNVLSWLTSNLCIVVIVGLVLIGLSIIAERKK